jgi:hypothetical protein
MIELYGSRFFVAYDYRPQHLKDGYLSTPGYDWGGGQRNALKIIWNSGDYRVLVVKCKGYTGWDGVGQTSYFSAFYMLLERHKIYDNKGGQNTGTRYVRLAEFEFGRRVKRGVEALVNVGKLLERGLVTDIKADLEVAKGLASEAI